MIDEAMMESEQTLTESRLPGTTLQVTKVKNNLGLRLFDTPGFPVNNAGPNNQNIKL